MNYRTGPIISETVSMIIVTQSTLKTKAYNLEGHNPEQDRIREDEEGKQETNDPADNQQVGLNGKRTEQYRQHVRHVRLNPRRCSFAEHTATSRGKKTFEDSVTWSLRSVDFPTWVKLTQCREKGFIRLALVGELLSKLL